MTRPRLASLLAAAALAAGGAAARWSELGTWGLSNDEAWVGLATRVEGLDQFRLAIAATPVAWAALVKLASLVSADDPALRAVPFLFGCLAMAVAYRAGSRFAGNALGGVLALAAVAFDPLSIAYARILKQYTAEAFFCLLALDRAAAFADGPTRGRLGAVVLVLLAGFGFSNAQLLVAPPVMGTLLGGALLAQAALRRRMRRDVAIATAVVGACAVLYYRLLVAPRLPATLDPYWAAQLYLPFGAAAPQIAWTSLAPTLGAALGAFGAPIALVCLAGAALLRARAGAVVVAALVLLCVELAGLSMLRIVAVNQPRVLIFLTTALVAFGAAAVGLVVVRAWERPAAGAVATLALTVLAADFARAHAWRALGRSILVEDAGPLVERIERERGPDDTVLVHQNTGFIWAYYQRATPVLDRSHGPSVGYLPRSPDARVVLVGDRDVEAKAAAALATSPRVWVVASRLRGPREQRLRDALARAGTTAAEARRPSALLVVLTRRAPR